jgi:hypothetical protein
MPKKPSSTPGKKPVAKKAARKAVVRKTVKKAVKTVALKKVVRKKQVVTTPVKAKRPRARVIKEHPDNIAVDAHDHGAVEALGRARAKTVRASRRITAVDIAAAPPQGEAGAASMVERVSDAIERELTKIERIVGNPTRVLPAQRIETESRARVLASLARTLKEVMRLREQERGDDKAKAADDDAVPRDLDEFRRELSRRLEGLVADAAPLPAGGNDAG